MENTGKERAQTSEKSGHMRACSAERLLRSVPKPSAPAADVA
jgi:hypothetical protein